MVLRILIVLFCWSGAAHAQPYLSSWADHGDRLAKLINPEPDEAFEIVITLDSGDYEINGATFAVHFFPENGLVPEVSYPSDTTINLATSAPNQFQLQFGECLMPCAQREIVRLRYVNHGGVIQPNTKFILGGADGVAFEQQATDCAGTVHDAVLVGPPNIHDGADEYLPLNGMVLNWEGACTLIGYYCGMPETPDLTCEQALPNQSGSFSILKAQF
jgi:hypothetical protein